MYWSFRSASYLFNIFILFDCVNSGFCCLHWMAMFLLFSQNFGLCPPAEASSCSSAFHQIQLFFSVFVPIENEHGGYTLQLVMYEIREMNKGKSCGWRGGECGMHRKYVFLVQRVSMQSFLLFLKTYNDCSQSQSQLRSLKSFMRSQCIYLNNSCFNS